MGPEHSSTNLMWTGHSYGHVWSLQWHGLVGPTGRCGLVGPVYLSSVDVDLLVLCTPLWNWTCGSYVFLRGNGLVGPMCSSVELDLWVLCVPLWKWTCGSYVFLCGNGLVGPMCSSMEVDLWVLCVPQGRGSGLVGPMSSSVEVDLWILHVLCSSIDVDLWVLYKWLWNCWSCGP